MKRKIVLVGMTLLLPIWFPAVIILALLQWMYGVADDFLAEILGWSKP